MSGTDGGATQRGETGSDIWESSFRDGGFGKKPERGRDSGSRDDSIPTDDVPTNDRVPMQKRADNGNHPLGGSPESAHGNGAIRPWDARIPDGMPPENGVPPENGMTPRVASEEETEAADDLSPSVPSPRHLHDPANRGRAKAFSPHRLARRSFLDAKRMVDFTFALAILIVTLPIIFVCAFLIKVTSRGPVFYKQQRVGMNGRLFDIIKLRTMRTNAEAQTGPVWAKDNDPRITWIGRFLRKSHLDELPQLINVLKGDMSLVGPRPERTIFVNEFNHSISQYYKRLSVKPGITGLAQVRYKYDETITDVRRKLAYDLLYIKKMCWYLDLTIILLTVGKLLDRGAK